MRDYTYEILKFLYDNDGKVDVELLMTQLTKETDATKIQDEKQTIAYHIIAAKDPEKKFIEPIPLTLSSEFSNRYFNRGQQWFNDDVTIELQLRQEGVKEYRRLDKIHNPPPDTPTQHFEFHNSPNAVVAGRDVNMRDNKPNEESTESKELTKKLLDDFPKTVWYRKQGFIYLIVGLIIATILGLLQLCNRN
jgi:hypothetical protein